MLVFTELVECQMKVALHGALKCPGRKTLRCVWTHYEGVCLQQRGIAVVMLRRNVAVSTENQTGCFGNSFNFEPTYLAGGMV